MKAIIGPIVKQIWLLFLYIILQFYKQNSLQLSQSTKELQLYAASRGHLLKFPNHYCLFFISSPIWVDHFVRPSF